MACLARLATRPRYVGVAWRGRGEQKNVMEKTPGSHGGEVGEVTKRSAKCQDTPITFITYCRNDYYYQSIGGTDSPVLVGYHLSANKSLLLYGKV